MQAEVWFGRRVRDQLSQQDAAASTLAFIEGQEGSTCGSLEDVVDAIATQAGALEISLGTRLSSNNLGVVRRNEAKRLLPHLLDRNRVFSEVLLQPDEDNGNASAKTGGLFDPLYRRRQLVSDRDKKGLCSGYMHRRALCFTLSRESGESIEKPINSTWAFEYASGRKRS